MARHAGPTINESGLLFSIDARNLKSISNTNTLTSLITQERVSTKTTTDLNYFNSNYSSNNFLNFNISNNSVIAVNFNCENLNSNRGYIFSISSFASDFHSPKVGTSYSTGPELTTIGTGYTSFATNTNTSGITSYSTGPILNTISNQIISQYTYPSLELSCFMTESGIILNNKLFDQKATLSYTHNTTNKNTYSITYRTSSESFIPISVNINNQLTINSNSITGIYSNFQSSNVKFSAFNLEDANYFQYGVKYINAYNREITTDDIFYINKL